jgi:pilus assembly protein CpaB
MRRGADESADGARRCGQAVAMSRRRRAALLVGLALVLGGLAASDVVRREAAVQAQLGPPVEVLVARADLPAGRRIGAGDLARRRLPRRYAPVGAATFPEALIGRRLGATVPRGGYLGAGQLAPAATATGPAVRRGERAAEVVGLGSPALVVPGARVDVLVTRDADADAGAAAGTELALEDVEVVAVRPAPAAGARDDGAQRVAATLRVSVRQAVYLAAAQSFARAVRLLPRAAGDRARSGGLRVGEALR